MLGKGHTDNSDRSVASTAQARDAQLKQHSCEGVERLQAGPCKSRVDFPPCGENRQTRKSIGN